MKPIIFSTDMVKAILAGHKTMTRRVIKPQPVTYAGSEAWGMNWYNRNGRLIGFGAFDPDTATDLAPYKPGDVLYVREAWDCTDMSATIGTVNKFLIRYAADGAQAIALMPESFNPIMHSPHRWRPSIHMPREAARVFLRVTDVKAERLQDISEADAKAEGVEKDSCFDFPTYVTGFCKSWESIYAKKPECQWDANPWIWKIAFERTEKQ